MASQHVGAAQTCAETMIATNRSARFERPVCAWPKLPYYRSADPAMAASLSVDERLRLSRFANACHHSVGAGGFLSDGVPSFRSSP